MTTRFSQGNKMGLRRKVKLHRCPVCETEFRGISLARFCSNACRQRDKREQAKWVG